jgi:hypothetical protein
VPPPYTTEEREEVHRHDLELLNGGADRQRLVPGWQSESAQAMVDRWKDQARRRLERLVNGEDFRRVYEGYDDEFDELLPYTEEELLND